MTPLEKHNLDRYRKALGEISITECLELAILSEQTKKDVGPWDPAFEHFAQQERVYFEFAHLMEKEKAQ